MCQCTSYKIIMFLESNNNIIFILKLIRKLDQNNNQIYLKYSVTYKRTM